MTEGKKVTVLMPCYNAAAYFHEAVDSVLNQSYSNLEILLIDDGSKDNTAELITKYSQIDSRIVPVFNEKNMGLIKTLNKGVQLATGDFIARMDADDISHPDRIKLLLKEFDLDPKLDVISAGFYYISYDGIVKRQAHPKALQSKSLQFVSFFCTPVNHPCVVGKASVFKANPFDDQYIHSEDYEIFSRLLADGYRFKNYELPLYFLRMNPESVSYKFEKIQISTHTKISVRNIENYFNKRFDFFLHKVMINRISFNVSYKLLNEALETLDMLRNEFLKNEKPDTSVVAEIDEFLIEQKIDILLQSFKSARFKHKGVILWNIFAHLPLFIHKRGSRYFLSKLPFMNRNLPEIPRFKSSVI